MWTGQFNCDQQLVAQRASRTRGRLAPSTHESWRPGSRPTRALRPAGRRSGPPRARSTPWQRTGAWRGCLQSLLPFRPVRSGRSVHEPRASSSDGRGLPAQPSRIRYAGQRPPLDRCLSSVMPTAGYAMRRAPGKRLGKRVSATSYQRRPMTFSRYCWTRSTIGMMAGGCASSIPSSSMTGPR